MLKYILTGISCLWLFVLYSQEEVSFALPAIIPNAIMDSAIAVPSVDVSLRNNSKVLLSWKVTNNSIDFFSIERSCNGKEFETLAVLKQVTGQLKMNWIDEQPAKGKNQYRIVCSTLEGKKSYSGVITAQVNGNISFRFYPNPVDDVLIVRSEQAIDITVIDEYGKVRITENQLQGLQMINVSTLEKGVYILRVYNQQLNLQSQEKLVKK